MDRLLAGLIRRLAGLLADGRRDWVQALLAEVDDVPARSARLAWLGLAGYVAGLLVLTSRRVMFTRRVLPVAAGVGALTAVVLYPLAPFGTDTMLEQAMHGGTVADYLVLTCFALAAVAVPVAVH